MPFARNQDICGPDGYILDGSEPSRSEGSTERQSHILRLLSGNTLVRLNGPDVQMLGALQLGQ
jgi:hypothetical protein